MRGYSTRHHRCWGNACASPFWQEEGKAKQHPCPCRRRTSPFWREEGGGRSKTLVVVIVVVAVVKEHGMLPLKLGESGSGSVVIVVHPDGAFEIEANGDV